MNDNNTILNRQSLKPVHGVPVSVGVSPGVCVYLCGTCICRCLPGCMYIPVRHRYIHPGRHTYIRALILFIHTLALYKAFTYLLAHRCVRARRLRVYVSLTLDLDSSRIQLDTLGHTPTPSISVKSCHLCFLPGEPHLL